MQIIYRLFLSLLLALQLSLAGGVPSHAYVSGDLSGGKASIKTVTSADASKHGLQKSSGSNTLYDPVTQVNYAVGKDGLIYEVSSLSGFNPIPLSKPLTSAPNTGVPSGWKSIGGAGAQITPPKGFKSYTTPDGDIVHVSPGGLKYGYDKNFGNRVDHVLDHTAPNPAKSKHTVFNTKGDDALALVDEAWGKRGSSLPNDSNAFVVNLGRTVGTKGETSIRVVVDPKTNNIITAYPQ